MRLMKENHAVKNWVNWLYWQDFNYFKSNNWWSIFFSLTSAIGAPVGIASASFTLIFSITTRIVTKITEYNKKQKEKAWSDSYAS